jgi:hypothetical protein
MPFCRERVEEVVFVVAFSVVMKVARLGYR